MITKVEINTDLSLIIFSENSIDHFEISSLESFKPESAKISLIGVVNQHLIKEVEDFIRDEHQTNPNLLIFLTDRKPLPKISGLEQGCLNSFICSWEIFSVCQSVLLPQNYEMWAYHLVSCIYSSVISPDRLEIIQLPIDETPKEIEIKTNVKYNFILPHKGHTADLKACLQMIRKNVKTRFDVYVGIDESEIDDLELKTLIQQHNDWHFFQPNPSGVGPYVIRELLIDLLTDDEYIIFQDSDDIPTTNRLSKLNSMMKTEYDMIGSHELIFDDITKTLRVKRFPKDVNLALETSPAFPLLHSTAATSVKAFRKTGGYSTNRKFANDTQFLFRCYFNLRIRNIDDFLYIRKVHQKSLTNDPSHPLEGSERKELAKRWCQDFSLVLNKKLELNQSSLKADKIEGVHLKRIKF